MDNKFNQVLVSNTAHSAAIDDMKSMMQNYMGRSKAQDDESLSITQCALENQDLFGLLDKQVAGLVPHSCKKVVCMDLVMEKTTGTVGGQGGENTEDG